MYAKASVHGKEVTALDLATSKKGKEEVKFAANTVSNVKYIGVNGVIIVIFFMNRICFIKINI